LALKWRFAVKGIQCCSSELGIGGMKFIGLTFLDISGYD
jgi:hypothetical protein